MVSTIVATTSNERNFVDSHPRLDPNHGGLWAARFAHAHRILHDDLPSVWRFDRSLPGDTVGRAYRLRRRRSRTRGRSNRHHQYQFVRVQVDGLSDGADDGWSERGGDRREEDAKWISRRAWRTELVRADSGCHLAITWWCGLEHGRGWRRPRWHGGRVRVLLQGLRDAAGTKSRVSIHLEVLRLRPTAGAPDRQGFARISGQVGAIRA